jgi:hypothetical protein
MYGITPYMIKPCKLRKNLSERPLAPRKYSWCNPPRISGECRRGANFASTASRKRVAMISDASAAM